MNQRIQAQTLPLHHRPGGGFRNPWPASEPHGVGDLLKWMATRKRLPESSEVAKSRPLSTGLLDLSATEFAITWIGHSTFLIRSGGVSVLTDPIWSDRASPVQFAGPRRHSPPGLSFDALPIVDAVFLSHDHYDHLDDQTIRRLIERYPGANWITPIGVGRFLRRRGATDVTELDWWESATIGRVFAGCMPAMHFSGRYPWNRNTTLWCGWTIGIDDHRIFFAGDTGLHPEFGDIAGRYGPLDAAILPIGAYEPRWFMQPVHMSPEDAVAAYAAILGSGGSDQCIFVPSHWGTFRLTDEPLDEPPRRLHRAWAQADLPVERLWLLQPGETRRST